MAFSVSFIPHHKNNKNINPFWLWIQTFLNSLFLSYLAHSNNTFTFIDNQYKSMLTFALVSNSFLLNEWTGKTCTWLSSNIGYFHFFLCDFLLINSMEKKTTENFFILNWLICTEIIQSCSSARAHTYNSWKLGQHQFLLVFVLNYSKYHAIFVRDPLWCNRQIY